MECFYSTITSAPRISHYYIFSAEVDVIYAKVKPVTTNGDPEVLQKMADMIVDKFIASGLMRRQYDRVKLHLTVMNTAFQKTAQEKMETSVENHVPADNRKDMGTITRERIDARDILKNFGNRHFGQTHIKEMHLSQLKTGRRIDDKYYSASTIVQFSNCG